MITLKEISKRVGARTLFENVSFTFNNNCRYGLTGPNGCGKSTLLKIVMGVEESTTGEVALPRKVGFMKQQIEEFANRTLVDTVIMGNKRLWDALSERERLYEAEMTDEVGMRLGDLEGIVGEEDGYTAESDAEILLSGMGFTEEMFRKKMSDIPLDRQFRVLLCQALFGSPEALLLDEPTNHLDLESISWLEEFLHGYKGTLIVVSHDRHFLNAVCTHIADIDYETITEYPGNYDAMIEMKLENRAGLEDINKNREKKIAQLKEFIAKFSAGTRSSQVQSRKKEMQRLQPLELKRTNIQRPYIRFPNPDKQSGQVVYKLDKICKSFEHKVIDKLSCEIQKGDKIAVIGNNGRGKTTFLKMLASKLEPDSGAITLGHNIELGYFPQNHHEIIDKQSNQNIFEWLRNHRSTTSDQDVRSILGKMLFSGEDQFKEIRKLSGGETARLIIGSLLLTAPNTLILDEPNGHLDLEAVSALGDSLEEFNGTVVMASHDRGLIDSFATKVIALESDGVHFFQGPLEEYFARKKNV